MYLDKSVSFLKARKTREVEVPELGEGLKVIIREISVKQAANLGDDLVKQMAAMIVDESGNPVFTSDEDLANLAEMSTAISGRIFEAANDMNGTSKAAQEETVKN